MIKYVGIRKSK